MTPCHLSVKEKYVSIAVDLTCELSIASDCSDLLWWLANSVSCFLPSQFKLVVVSNVWHIGQCFLSGISIRDRLKSVFKKTFYALKDPETYFLCQFSERLSRHFPGNCKTGSKYGLNIPNSKIKNAPKRFKHWHDITRNASLIWSIPWSGGLCRTRRSPMQAGIVS